MSRRKKPAVAPTIALRDFDRGPETLRSDGSLASAKVAEFATQTWCSMRGGPRATSRIALIFQ